MGLLGPSPPILPGQDKLPSKLIDHHPTIRTDSSSVKFYLFGYRVLFIRKRWHLCFHSGAFTASFSRYISTLGGFGGPERTEKFSSIRGDV